MLPIKYKIVMDEKGYLIGVELWQGSEHITVSMAAEGTHKNGYRWLEVKEFLDTLRLPTGYGFEDVGKRILEAKREVHPLPTTEA